MQGKQKPRSNKKGCESCETVKSIRNSSTIKKEYSKYFYQHWKGISIKQKL